MCYKVFTHTMVCDKRPVVSSGKTDYVSPYDAPLSCSCARHSAAASRSERCSWHDCCRLQVRLHQCRRRSPCSPPVLYHQYAQLVSHDASRARRHSYPPPRASRSRSYSFSQPAWPSLHVLDASPDFHAAESTGFRAALDRLAHTGHVVRHACGERGNAWLRVERERRRHREAHGGGCGTGARVCEWTRSVRAMAAEADNWDVVVGYLGFCWVENVRFLRIYEGMGDRRVHGIVEDVEVPRESYRGERRHHRRVEKDEERGPAVYAHRESRIKVEEPARGRDRERKRHHDGERRHSTRTTYVVREKHASHEEPSLGDCGRSWWRFR